MFNLNGFPLDITPSLDTTDIQPGGGSCGIVLPSNLLVPPVKSTPIVVVPPAAPADESKQ